MATVETRYKESFCGPKTHSFNRNSLNRNPMLKRWEEGQDANVIKNMPLLKINLK